MDFIFKEQTLGISGISKMSELHAADPSLITHLLCSPKQSLIERAAKLRLTKGLESKGKIMLLIHVTME